MNLSTIRGDLLIRHFCVVSCSCDVAAVEYFGVFVNAPTSGRKEATGQVADPWNSDTRCLHLLVHLRKLSLTYFD